MRATGRIHHAILSRSPRLQKALSALEAVPAGLTTLELIQRTGLCAINSVISELRSNGCTIYCRNEGKTADGAQIYRYRLIQGAQ